MAAETASPPCSSDARSSVATGSSQTRRARIEGERLQAGVDHRTVLGRAAHHRRPDEQARLEGRDGPAVAVAVPAVIGVHEDVGAALQLGIEPARRFELEAAGAGAGNGQAVDAVARQQITGPPGPVDRLDDRVAPLVPTAKVLSAHGRSRISQNCSRLGSRLSIRPQLIDKLFPVLHVQVASTRAILRRAAYPCLHFIGVVTVE